jgi:hypothetical protein
VQPIEATPIDRVEAPRVDRQFAEPPKIEAPIVQPIPRIEAAPIEHVEAPRIERQFAEPPRIEAPVVQPVETPALPAPRKESNAPVTSVPVTSAPAAPPAETLPSAEVPATAKPVAPPMERPAATPAPATRDVAPRIDRDNAPIEQAPSSPFRGTPSRPDESASPGRATPSLDLDALRKRAGDITRQGTGNRAALPFPMPPVEKRKTKMEEALEKARKPDCRTAYKELGLAAVVPLIANEFGEGTCRW